MRGTGRVFSNIMRGNGHIISKSPCIADALSNTMRGSGHVFSNTMRGTGHVISNTMRGTGHVFSNTMRGSGHVFSNIMSGNGHIISNRLHSRCTLCGQTFTQSTHCRTHMRESHSNERNWSCDVAGCNKSFKRQDHLQRHQAFHKAEK